MVHTRLMSHVVTGGENVAISSSDSDAGPSKSAATSAGPGPRPHNNDKLQELGSATTATYDPNKTTGTAVNLLQLPAEIVEKVLGFVSYRDVCRLRAVSRKMNELCCGHLNVSFYRLQAAMLARFQRLKSQMPRRESSRRNHPLACESEIVETLHMRLTLLQMTFGKHIERRHVCFFAGDILDEVCRILRYVATTTPNLARPYKVTDELFDLSTMAMEYFKERIEPSLPEISCFTSDFLDYANPFSASSTTSGSFSVDESVVAEESSYRDRKAPPPRSAMVLRTRIRHIKQGMKKYNNQLSMLYRDVRKHKGRAAKQQKLLADISARLDDRDKKNEETSRKFSTLLQELNKCKTELQYWRFKAPAVSAACTGCGRPFPAPPAPPPPTLADDQAWIYYDLAAVMPPQPPPVDDEWAEQLAWGTDGKKGDDPPPPEHDPPAGCGEETASCVVAVPTPKRKTSGAEDAAASPVPAARDGHDAKKTKRPLKGRKK